MLIKELRKYNNVFQHILILLIVLYAFTIPLGIVFRKEGDVLPYIDLTFLTYAITIFSVFSVFSSKHFKSNFAINLLIVLSIYLLINTIFFSNEFSKNIITWFGFLSNILLSLFVSNVNFKKSFLHLLFYTLSIGALISSLLTLIDNFNILNIPYFNESSFRLIGFDVRGGSGPFVSRTTMGAFYSIVMPISLFSFLYLKKPIYLISTVVSFLAMISTFNRGAPFALFIVFLIFLVRKRVFNLKIVVTTLITVLLVGSVIYNSFSQEQRNAFRFLLLSSINVEEKTEIQAESDGVRIQALKQIVTKEIVENPFGHGFNDFHLAGSLEPISVHSNLNYILYSTGVFGIFWLIFFLGRLYKFSQKLKGEEQMIIKYSLFSWVLYSLTHMVLNTFLAWLLFGLLLNRNILSGNTNLSGKQS